MDDTERDQVQSNTTPHAGPLAEHMQLRAYPKTHWDHDGLSFRGGQGGCSGGNTQGGLSPEQITPLGMKRQATRCGHGVFYPAAVFRAGAKTTAGIGPRLAPCGQGRTRHVMTQRVFG